MAISGFEVTTVAALAMASKSSVKPNLLLSEGTSRDISRQRQM
jgi:hypothetical protein